MKIFLLALIFILGSCAKSAKPRSVVLTIASQSNALTAPSIDGGMILRMDSSTGESKVVEVPAPPYEIVLTNGEWTIYAIGFTGPNPFEGTSYCGQTKTTLVGTDATVAIDASATNCSSSPFAQIIAAKKTNWDSALWDQGKWEP